MKKTLLFALITLSLAATTQAATLLPAGSRDATPSQLPPIATHGLSSTVRLISSRM